MKATARAHPIQGLVKYHGMRDFELRQPYHDSISVCTAPSNTTTTVEWEPDAAADTVVVDGETVTGGDAERVVGVADHVRELAGFDHALRLESVNSFPTNVGFGSSASGFAAAATAMVAAAGLDRTRPEISAIARRGSASAARSVTGAFSDLHVGLNDVDCRSERIDVGIGPDGFDPESDLRIVTALVPSYKETAAAHEEAADSHMFQARRAHVQDQLAEVRDALRSGAFDRIFRTAEHDSLSLAATTMTGPAGWVYWQPDTLAVFDEVRRLREEAAVPVYFSTDTGASVYVNTTAEHVDTVETAVSDLGVETNVWEVGGPARVLDGSEALF